MPLIFLRQLISSVGGKFSKNFSKIHLESEFENQCIKIGCYNYTFTFCNFFKIFKVVEKVLKIKALGNNQNYQTVICFLLSSVIVKIFFTKTAKISQYSNACIIYSTLGSNFLPLSSTCFGK